MCKRKGRSFSMGYYLYKGNDNIFTVFYDRPTELEPLYEVERLPELPDGGGTLKQAEDGTFYYEPFHEVEIPEPIESIEPQPTLEEMQARTLLNTEYLVVLSEVNNA